MDKAARRKLRRRTIRRYNKTRERLVARGAKHLPTLRALQSKQRGMLNRFHEHGVPESEWHHLRRCRPGRCRCGSETAACWFADRTASHDLNHRARRILRRAKNPLHYVTILDPHYSVPVGELPSLSINGMMGSLRRRFRLAGDLLRGDMAFGYIEIALEILPDEREIWFAHFHIVVASHASADAIRDALYPPRDMPDPENWGRLRWKPIEVKPVTHLANLLGYNAKRPPEHNRITVDRDGALTRNPDRLRSRHQVEYDLWLLRQKPSERVFKRGMKEVRGKLVPMRAGA